MNKDTLCDDLQKLNDEEVQSFFIQDAITLIHEQQAEIEALKAEIEALKGELENVWAKTGTYPGLRKYERDYDECKGI